MNMIEAVKSVLSNYFTFSGRALRSEFWWWQLFSIIISFVMAFLDTAVLGMGEVVSEVTETGFSTIYNTGPLGAIWGLGVMIPSLAVGARRLHDGDRSGWWQLLYFLPIIGWIVLLIWFIKSGSQGTNRFGNHPLSADASVFR